MKIIYSKNFGFRSLAASCVAEAVSMFPGNFRRRLQADCEGKSNVHRDAVAANTRWGSTPKAEDRPRKPTDKNEEHNSNIKDFNKH
jgi:hypothetical protein